MKAVSVKYGKLVNLGNYENERYEAELLVEEGDHIQEVIKNARGVVDIAIEARKLEDEERERAEEAARKERKLEWARGVMANPVAFDTWDVREASGLLGVPNPFVAAPAGEDSPPF